MSDKASTSKVKINYINRLPLVLTTSILTHLTVNDLWAASCASRQLYVACCYDATIWQRAIAALGSFKTPTGHDFPIPPAGFVDIYEDNLYHCLKPLSLSSSSSSSYMDISLLPRGGKQLVSLYKWRSQWRSIIRCRDTTLLPPKFPLDYGKHEMKICVCGSGGSGKSALTIRYVTGNICIHSILPLPVSIYHMTLH
jgi:hypothetical protein